jgi:5-oxopent-3-ene-1,2,5-tricarboxylate decarboxylase/2-hydroxyhepta-2,4-diene-1,7-dioate isomerase
MKIAVFKPAANSVERHIGVVEKDQVIDLGRASVLYGEERGEAGIAELKTWRQFLQLLMERREALNELIEFAGERLRETGMTYRLTDVRLCAPVEEPRNIICVGRNYLAHARETGHEAPREPIFFAKSPSAVIDPGEAIIYASSLTRVDPEAELAVIIGRRAWQAKASDAARYIAGYTALNDVTARDLQKQDIAQGHPWFRSKSMDTFCPIGPVMLTADECPEPVELDVSCRVNGEVRQRANTRQFLFSIPQLLEAITRFITLEIGDVIATGTPEGIQPIFPGDVVEVEVERIGILRNPIIAPQRWCVRNQAKIGCILGFLSISFPQGLR